MRERAERGQAMVLIALAFVGLAAFIGLAVDAGILFSNVGNLRRATDAAALAAANQFREGWAPPDLSAEAVEMLRLNGIPDAKAQAWVCDLSDLTMDPPFYSTTTPPYHDDALCPGEEYPPSGSDAPRKVVRVEAKMDVEFAFLRIIGFDSTTIRANAESQAASIDLVLALDVSDSMAVDLCKDTEDNDGDGYTDADDCKGSTIVPLPEPFEDDVEKCLLATASSHYPYPLEPFDIEAVFPNECHPFESVRYAAHRLVDRMYFPYDRLSIVTFGRMPDVKLELDDTDSLPAVCLDPTDPKDCAHKVLDALRVELSPSDSDAKLGTSLCESSTPRGCMSTNIGDGLLQAGARFCVDDNPLNGDCDRAEMREEAVWIVILLTDGAANAAIGNGNPAVFSDWICPDTTYPPPLPPDPPYCRESPTNRLNSNYDADDYARDQADNVGCLGPGIPLPTGSGCPGAGGVGSVIFTIGLGDLVTENPDDLTEPRAGELLLRYIADVGRDGEPEPPEFVGLPADPFDCYPDPPERKNCGNYYFAPQGKDLAPIFEEIASQIYTIITH